MPPASEPVNDASGLLRQAVDHHQHGRLAEAEKLYRQVLALAPMQADAHNLLGVIAYQTGHLDAAVDLMNRAASLNPKDPNIQLNLANALLAIGDAGGSAARFRAVLSLNPGHAGAANGLGMALRNLGQPDEALRCFEQAARLDPGLWDAQFNLGCAYELSARPDAALGYYERALALQPASPLVLGNLGNVKRQLGRLAEAESDLRRSLELDPRAAVNHLNLGAILLATGKTDAAIESFRAAASLAPGMPEALNNLARAFQEKKDFDEQVRCSKEALKLRPDYTEAMVNLGCALREQGRTAEAMDWFRRAAASDAAHHGARVNVLYSMLLLPEYDRAAIFAANRDFWLHESPSAPAAAAHANTAEPQRRLRVGYVSGDFRRHAAAFFLEPLLAHHDRREFEVFCYSNNAIEDEYTARFRNLADSWRGIHEVSDADAAAMIQADHIDILVDLSGNTGNNRLAVFARRPAPVQVTYLGYPATTGLAAMDFRLTDAIADPPGIADPYYTEKLRRLTDALVCYLPPPDLPDVNPLPAATNGYVTFGSFNSVAKVGLEVVSLWAQILKGVPRSRLLITSIPTGYAQTRMTELFAGFGIDASRLKMVPGLSNFELLNLYREVDIALDSFPCGGGTGTCESLWMGVPRVCLAGKTFAGRVAPSMLAAAGLSDWVATDRDEYVDIAFGLAGDLTRLAAIRGGLRDRVSNSPLADARKFARGVEKAFRAMWTEWCSARGKPPEQA